MDERPVGGTRPLRFLVVAAPATGACLGLVAGIALGYVSVAFAAARPFDVATRHGDADSLYFALDTDSAITGLSMGDPRSAALVEVTDGRLDDLCLTPRLDLPIVGRLASLKIASGGRVGLGDTTLAAGESQVGGLGVPHLDVGARGDGEHPGAFSLRAGGDGEPVKLDGVDLRAYGLVLEGGIRLRTLALRPALGDQNC